MGVAVRAYRVEKSVQLVCTAAEPYGVNHLLDISSVAYGSLFGAFGVFGTPWIPFDSPLIPFGSH
jgi:hypothetical protein